MDKTTLLTVLIGAMVLVSLFQAVQIMGLTSTVSGGSVTGTAVIGTTAKTVTMPTAATKTNNGLNNLPSMVGGC